MQNSITRKFINLLEGLINQAKIEEFTKRAVEQVSATVKSRCVFTSCLAKCDCRSGNGFGDGIPNESSFRRNKLTYGRSEQYR